MNTLDFMAWAHYGGSGAKDPFHIESVEPNFDPTQWHLYTQAWGPGFRAYYVDGQLVGSSTNHVWSGPERWQLQIEPSGTNDGGSGHIYVKWVWIGTPMSGLLDTRLASGGVVRLRRRRAEGDLALVSGSASPRRS